MISIGANGKRIAYGIKHYNVDTLDDKDSLPTANLKMGSTCFVIENSSKWMLNGKSEWIEILSGSSGPAVPPEEEDDEIIYDGGVV